MKDVDREAKNVCNGEMPYATLMAMWALEMDKTTNSAMNSNYDVLEGGSSRPALSFIFIIFVLYSLSSQILLYLEYTTLLMHSLSRISNALNAFSLFYFSQDIPFHS